MNAQDIVGKYLNSQEVTIFLNSLMDAPEVDQFAGMKILDFPRLGIMLYVGENDTIVSILLHSDGHEGYEGYQGKMPRGLEFSDSKQRVLERFSEASLSGVDKETGETWERFDFKEYCVHITYGLCRTRIRQVTLMTPKIAAGRLD